jgi:hypothetical protein
VYSSFIHAMQSGHVPQGVLSEVTARSFYVCAHMEMQQSAAGHVPHDGLSFSKPGGCIIP